MKLKLLKGDKIMKKIFSILILTVSLFGLTGCFFFVKMEGPDVSLIEAIEFENSEATIKVNEFKRLEVIVTPDNNAYSYNWSSSDDSVVKVENNGEITGLSVGTATITATINNLTASIIITVTEY